MTVGDHHPTQFFAETASLQNHFNRLIFLKVAGRYVKFDKLLLKRNVAQNCIFKNVRGEVNLSRSDLVWSKLDNNEALGFHHRMLVLSNIRVNIFRLCSFWRSNSFLLSSGLSVVCFKTRENVCHSFHSSSRWDWLAQRSCRILNVTHHDTRQMPSSSSSTVSDTLWLIRALVPSVTTWHGTCWADKPKPSTWRFCHLLQDPFQLKMALDERFH